MKASIAQLDALRLVARRLEAMNEKVVFVGGMMSGLLVTAPGSPPARPTKDVDLVVQVASTVEYQTKLRDHLIEKGFREDSRPGAPICRWVVGGVTVDIMPTDPRVLGFSNQWYDHAVRTAGTIVLPPDAEGSVRIRVISAPSFLATKLTAWKSRGNGDLMHHDIEDVVSVVDGREELLAEIEEEPSSLRRFLADAVASLFAAGFEDQIPGHLLPDDASQRRFSSVLTSLRRIERCPRVTKIGEKISAVMQGDPGATGIAAHEKWDWEIIEIANAVASKPPRGNSHVAVLARLTSHSKTAGVAGDGRHVLIEDSLGRRFRPLYKLLHAECKQRGLREPYDQILPGEPFEAVWVFELPVAARVLRLILPFEGRELGLDSIPIS